LCRATFARRVSFLPVAVKSFRVVSSVDKMLRRATCTRRVVPLRAATDPFLGPQYPRVVSFVSRILRHAEWFAPLRVTTAFLRHPSFLWARSCPFLRRPASRLRSCFFWRRTAARSRRWSRRLFLGSLAGILAASSTGTSWSSATSLLSGAFPRHLKYSILKPLFKMVIERMFPTTDQYLYLPLSQKSLKK
jgi:hypothetical protein